MIARHDAVAATGLHRAREIHAALRVSQGQQDRGVVKFCRLPDSPAMAHMAAVQIDIRVARAAVDDRCSAGNAV